MTNIASYRNQMTKSDGHFIMSFVGVTTTGFTSIRCYNIHDSVLAGSNL